MESIKSSFLEYHQDNGFTTHESFPLVIDAPTVLFTNATITPFKSMLSGEAAFSNFALVQKCLRLGGTDGNAGERTTYKGISQGSTEPMPMQAYKDFNVL